MATNEDHLFLELAIERELLTREQADEILGLQAKLTDMGLAEPVADLLVKKKIIPAADAESIRGKVSPKGGRQQIKGYRLLDRVGSGGMGSVYKAVQISMDRTVALKVLKPSLVEDDQSVTRLQREAKLVGQMRHPNIVQGLDFGESNGFHYFAMEYVKGQSVKEMLEADGPMKESTALSIVTQVAKALEHAHGEGVVHRDIKPGNILVTKDGTALLADYGLAKGPLEDMELTKSGVTVGTPQYISPDQARGPSDVDIRTDIYSLGATLFHMLTGRTPYEGDTLAHLIQQVLYEPCAPVRSLRRDVSPDVAFLVAKMMARKPAHRYQSPTALLKDLKAIDEGRPIVPAGWEGSFEALATRKRFKVLAVATVLFFVVCVIVVVWYSMHLKEQARIEFEDKTRAFIEGRLGEADPENYARIIAELESLFRDEKFAATQAVADLADRKDIEKLRLQYKHVKDGNDLAQTTLDFVKEGRHRYADAIRRIDRFFEMHKKTKGKGADHARTRAEDLRVDLKEARDRFVAEALKTRLKLLSDREPEDAHDELDRAIGELRSRAYAEGEKADGLDTAEGIVDDLDFSIRRVGKYLKAARTALDDANYRNAESLLEGDRAEYEEHDELKSAMGRLDRNWKSNLDGRFDTLEKQIVSANQAEWVDVQAQATTAVDGGRFAEAIDKLSELGDRSIRDITVETRGIVEDLEERFDELKTTAGLEWDRFLPRFLEYFGNRNWAAADTELMNLRARVLTYQPDNEWETSWRGAKEALDLARAIEGTALTALDGRREATLKLGTIGDTVYDVKVDRSARTIRFSRVPGGEPETRPLRDLSVHDMFREAGHPADDTLARFVRAILRLGEVLRMSDPAKADHEIQIVEAWISEARTDDRLGRFPDRVVIYVREQQRLITERLMTDEARAERMFREAEAFYELQQWQDAYDKYSLLIDERKLRETKWVRAREASIKAAIADLKKRLPGARIGNYLGTKTQYLDGDSVNRSNLRIMISFAFRKLAELSRWRYTEGRVDLVEAEVIVAGPDLKEFTRRQSHLAFLPPANIRERRDWLQNHQLRLESPLLYSRDMSIGFRVRWKEPIALVVSLCGTNLLVLSDNGRKQNGRGVHIWQDESLLRPDRLRGVDILRRTYLDLNPGVLKGDAANHRYFQFEPNRWYRIRFEKKERYASLYVSGRLVYERDIKLRGAKGRDIVIQTWTACDIESLEMTGTIDKDWYNRRVK